MEPVPRRRVPYCDPPSAPVPTLLKLSMLRLDVPRGLGGAGLAAGSFSLSSRLNESMTYRPCPRILFARLYGIFIPFVVQPVTIRCTAFC